MSGNMDAPEDDVEVFDLIALYTDQGIELWLGKGATPSAS
jgi:hypothetical protein